MIELPVFATAPDTWYEVRLWMYNNKGDSAATIASERTPKSDGLSSLSLHLFQSLCMF